MVYSRKSFENAWTERRHNHMFSVGLLTISCSYFFPVLVRLFITLILGQLPHSRCPNLTIYFLFTFFLAQVLVTRILVLPVCTGIYFLYIGGGPWLHAEQKIRRQWRAYKGETKHGHSKKGIRRRKKHVSSQTRFLIRF